MFWCAARLQPKREGLALHVLALNGYATYLDVCASIADRMAARSRRGRHCSPATLSWRSNCSGTLPGGAQA